jgi:hypothetical protein
MYGLENVSLEEIEPEIRDLVKIVNDIPFIDTNESCGGHVESIFSRRDGKIIPPSEEDIEAILMPAYMLFYVDSVIDDWDFRIKSWGHPLISEFIKKCENFAKKNPEVSFRQARIYDGANPRALFSINFGPKKGVCHNVNKEWAYENKKEQEKRIKKFEDMCISFIRKYFSPDYSLYPSYSC